MAEYDPSWPHGDIKEVFPDIYMVTGTNKTKYKGFTYQFSRNMIILRHNGELTLINTVRLNDEALKQLESLGAVKNIVRLGAFHGRDDPFYIDRYQASYWAFEGMKFKFDRQPDHFLTESGDTPIPGCSVFQFKLPRFIEGALVVDQQGGILITCDSIQNWQKADRYFNLFTRIWMHIKKHIGTAKITPTWKNACNPTADDYQRLLQHHFKHLLSAHGDPLLNDAHEKLSESVKRTFGGTS